MKKTDTNQNEFYRTSTEEDLTSDQKYEYINCMEEIQTKLFAASHHSDPEKAYDIQSTIKLTYGHLRDVVELLINCLIIISNIRNEEDNLDFVTGTKKKIQIIKKRQKIPFFIPISFPPEHRDTFRSIYDGKLYCITEDSGIAVPHNIHFNKIRKDTYLNLENLETLYDLSNKSQHSRIPFQKDLDYKKYLGDSENWIQKIQKLINLHWVSTENDRKIYVYQHRSETDGKAHFYTVEPIPPDSGWTYNPQK